VRLKRDVAKMCATVEQLSQSLQVAPAAPRVFFQRRVTRCARAQVIDDALERGETGKVSRMELQRRREMAGICRQAWLVTWMLLVQLRIAPQNPKTPSRKELIIKCKADLK